MSDESLIHHTTNFFCLVTAADEIPFEDQAVGALQMLEFMGLPQKHRREAVVAIAQVLRGLHDLSRMMPSGKQASGKPHVPFGFKTDLREIDGG